MAQLPKLKNEYTNRAVTDCFSGYRHRLKTDEGELYDCRNLTTEYYPLLANRKKRGRLRKLEEPAGLMAKDKLAWVEKGRLWYGGEATELAGLAPGEKQLVGMGSYICIFPDKLYYNTAQPEDRGSMEACYTSAGAVRISMCRADGSEYLPQSVDTEPPENPENAQLWVDSSSLPHVLRQWSSALEQWIEISAVYTKLSFTSCGELPELFSVNDGISINGAEVESVNGEKLICAIGGGAELCDYIVVPGLMEETRVQEEGFVKLERRVPDMDFVIECRNRLWGCRYGAEEGASLNEVYCCALGDFKNWRQFMGLASDSWTASVGSDGPWTGAVNYMGYPTFFKENRIHRVSISAYGAHQLGETVCRGVQRGSEKSIAVINETLYYKSRGDICAYQGGFPVSVSEALGDEDYCAAVAGAAGDSYCVSMKNQNGEAQFFVYDTARKLWIKEDGLECRFMATMGNELYAVADGCLYALRGSKGEPESHVEWMAESGILCYQYPDRKYLSRYNFRLQMEEGAQMDIFVQYDSSGIWERKGRIKFKGTGTVTVPVRPRRCDHLRIRLEGKGEFRLFSVAKILSIGSDV